MCEESSTREPADGQSEPVRSLYRARLLNAHFVVVRFGLRWVLTYQARFRAGSTLPAGSRLLRALFALDRGTLA